MRTPKPTLQNPCKQVFQTFFAVTKDKQLKGGWFYFGVVLGISVHCNGKNGTEKSSS